MALISHRASPARSGSAEEPDPTPRATPGGWTSPVPGLALAIAVSVAATFVGVALPVVGGPVIAVVGGIAISAVRSPSSRFRPGISFAAKRVLQGSIMVLGLGLSFSEVASTGRSSLPVLVGTLFIALGAAWLLGRSLRLPSDLTTLIGVGTAICGASAIAATDAVIDADEADVSYAIATIFVFNVVAVLTYPLLGHSLGLSQRAFGLWAGTAINDTSSVVAASTVYGHAAASFGVVVKLTRSLAIVPISLALARYRTRGRAAGDGTSAGALAETSDPAGRVRSRHGGNLLRVFPVFILGFVAAVTINTAGWVPSSWHSALSQLAGWMITVALAAVGLSTDVAAVRRAGFRPILLGALLWLIVGVSSLGLQTLTGAV